MDKIIKLTANENFYGCSPLVNQAILNHLDKVYLYPDYQQNTLKIKIAEINKVSASNIMLGVGSVGIIDAIIRLLVATDEEIITFERSFVAYGQLSERYQKKIHFAPLDHFACQTENIFPFLNEKTRVIFIANPNNPTGTVIDHQSLKNFIRNVPKDIYVVIDEAYLEYVTDPSFPDSVQLLEQFPNVIILRGFSKVYGIAGLRIGYGIASEKTATFLENHRLPYAINSVSAFAAMAALDDQDFMKTCVQKNTIEREYLYKGLKNAGYNVIPSQGNYLFMYFDTEYEKEQVHQKLAVKGIMVCNLAVFGQDLSLRIAIPDREVNERILDILGVPVQVAEDE
jgi:histidinol-phosphate aminotransferase